MWDGGLWGIKVEETLELFIGVPYNILFCNSIWHNTFFLDENTEVWTTFKGKYRFETVSQEIKIFI